MSEPAAEVARTTAELIQHIAYRLDGLEKGNRRILLILEGEDTKPEEGLKWRVKMLETGNLTRLELWKLWGPAVLAAVVAVTVALFSYSGQVKAAEMNHQTAIQVESLRTAVQQMEQRKSRP